MLLLVLGAVGACATVPSGRIHERGTMMVEKNCEAVRKDRYGFPPEEWPFRAITRGRRRAERSRCEGASMAGDEPIRAGDMQHNPAYDDSKPPSRENYLWRVIVTADLLGGTRNLVCDGHHLYLVHGEHRYSLSDEGLICTRAAHLAVPVRELAQVLAGLEARILQTVAAYGHRDNMRIATLP
jgi:hypothetical protein